MHAGSCVGRRPARGLRTRSHRHQRAGAQRTYVAAPQWRGTEGEPRRRRRHCVRILHSRGHFTIRWRREAERTRERDVTPRHTAAPPPAAAAARMRHPRPAFASPPRASRPQRPSPAPDIGSATRLIQPYKVSSHRILIDSVCPELFNSHHRWRE